MDNNPLTPDPKQYKYLRKQTKWGDLWFYQKTVVLYQMTVVFCKRFLPAYVDRTVDQMVQAARSGKQNIVEGSAMGLLPPRWRPSYSMWRAPASRNSRKTIWIIFQHTSCHCRIRGILAMQPCRLFAMTITVWLTMSLILSGGMMRCMPMPR